MSAEFGRCLLYPGEFQSGEQPYKEVSLSCHTRNTKDTSSNEYCICRHLSEYTHLEAELAFIDFNDLMTHIETVICEAVDLLLQDPRLAALLKTLHPNFQPPQRPFMRMSYKDAIKYLNEHGIKRKKDDDSEEMVDHAIGDDIAEAAERKMTDQLGVPMFLYGFPKDLKAFYMKKIKGDEEFTESCDLLMPNVGEIVGGSMRISDMQELLEGYKREGIDPAPYYWCVECFSTLRIAVWRTAA